MLRFLLTAATIVLAGKAAESSPPPELEPLSFLVGEWQASGPGQPSGASGRTVFSWSLQDRVIVRENYAEYPAAGEKAASRHDDLMVVYATAAGSVRADYYDSEGHVIRYSVSSPGARVAVFVSDLVPGEPRYRLSYELEPDPTERLKGGFEVAPPDQPEAFKRYLSWESERPKAAGKGSPGPRPSR